MHKIDEERVPRRGVVFLLYVCPGVGGDFPDRPYPLVSRSGAWIDEHGGFTTNCCRGGSVGHGREECIGSLDIWRGTRVRTLIRIGLETENKKTEQGNRIR